MYNRGSIHRMVLDCLNYVINLQFYLIEEFSLKKQMMWSK